MTKRRKLLLAGAIAIGLADVGYIHWLRSSKPDGMMAEWVAYMPGLEENQRKNPNNFLNTSDSHDPDYPSLYIDDGKEAYPLFVKLVRDCQIQDFAISQYERPTKSSAALSMPDRLFLGSMNAAAAACLQHSLPRGYVLAKLVSRTAPAKIGWGRDDLHVVNTQ